MEQRPHPRPLPREKGRKRALGGISASATRRRVAHGAAGSSLTGPVYAVPCPASGRKNGGLSRFPGWFSR